MDFKLNTKRLELNILSPSHDYAKKILTFYDKNRSIFEPIEPIRPPSFYSLPYHYSLLTGEYQLALQQKAFRYWIFLKSVPHHPIGTVSFFHLQFSAFQCCEIGYKIDPLYWNQGYAFEALSASIEAVFKQLKLHRIKANVLPENETSSHLLAKLGFEYEGLCKSAIQLDHTWRDVYQYALIDGKQKSE